MELNSHILKDPVAMRDKARETWIGRRTIEEQKVEKWHKALMQCSKERVLDKIPFDYTDMSTRTMVPEWYVEVPNPEVCAQQVAALNEKIDQINAIIRDINAEGLEALAEYNSLYASGGR